MKKPASDEPGSPTMKFEPFPAPDEGDDDAQLDLSFPCPWSYTLIGTEETRLRAAAEAILDGREHSFEFSHASRQGKYLSFHVRVTVTSNDDRINVGAQFNSHADIRFVL